MAAPTDTGDAVAAARDEYYERSRWSGDDPLSDAAMKSRHAVVLNRMRCYPCMLNNAEAIQKGPETVRILREKTLFGNYLGYLGNVVIGSTTLGDSWADDLSDLTLSMVRNAADGWEHRPAPHTTPSGVGIDAFSRKLIARSVFMALSIDLFCDALDYYYAKHPLPGKRDLIESIRARLRAESTELTAEDCKTAAERFAAAQERKGRLSPEEAAMARLKLRRTLSGHLRK